MPLVRRPSADGGNIDALSLPDHWRRCREPQLIHGYQPHGGKTGAHQTACRDHDPGERMIYLGEIPGADIEHDGSEGQCDDRTFQPYRPHVSMAEHEAHDEKDEGQPEQVNMRYADQRG